LGEPPRFIFEPLDKDKHDRAAFSCDSEILTNYLKQQARQDMDNRVAAVFVATADGKTIAGYYTLSALTIDAGDLPAEVLKRFKSKHPILPCTLIGRLARAAAYKRLGELLLMDALERALISSREVASLAVVVDAKDERAIYFYAKYGFIQFPDHPNRMFLPMKTVADMFARADAQ